MGLRRDAAFPTRVQTARTLVFLEALLGLVLLGVGLGFLPAGVFPGGPPQKSNPPQDLWVVNATVSESYTMSGEKTWSITTKTTPTDLVPVSQITVQKTEKISRSRTATALVSAVIPNEGSPDHLIFYEAKPVSMKVGGSLHEEDSLSSIETINGEIADFSSEEETKRDVQFSEATVQGEYYDKLKGFSIGATGKGPARTDRRRVERGRWKDLDPSHYERGGRVGFGFVEGEPGGSLVREGDTIRLFRTQSETKKSPSSAYGTVTEVTRKLISATFRRLSNGPPKADPGGPYEAERGATIILDGSRSKGNIFSYQWTFDPSPDCRSRLPAAPGPKEGISVSVVVLCPTICRLTVSDGNQSSSAEVTVRVKPREWKTPFEHVAQEGVLTPAIPPVIDPNLMVFSGGANVCSLDASQDENHSFHPGEKNGTWEDGGYKLVQVNDPGGPFDKAWYVGEYGFRISRQTVINPYLLPGGRPPVTYIEPWYSFNLARGAPVEAYLKALRDHEMEHSNRKRRALLANDPAKKIEERFGSDRDKLREELDRLVRDAEYAVCEASRDPFPVIWRGTLWFPRNDSGIYEEGDVEVGGPTQIETPPCRR